MTNLAVVLKDEIRRVTRKEIRKETQATTQAVRQYRREIARLKRQLRDQSRKIAFLETQERQRLSKATPASAEATQGIRFSARSVAAQRRRTGLSAADYGRLVGVSALTIYNWEQGKARPRKGQLAALVALRGIGKRGALAKLELLDTGQSKSAGKVQRRRRKK